MNNTQLKEVLCDFRKAIRKELPKVVESNLATGWTWFEGRDRLVKVMDTQSSKAGVLELEFNVKPDNKWASTPGFKFVPYATAYKKKLGTTKAVYRGKDIQVVKDLLKEVMVLFKKKENRGVWPTE